MKDTELYRQLLGIEKPWFVERVELDLEEGQVEVLVKHHRGVTWSCPECGQELRCRDHVEERTWRHLDTCQLKTFLRARIPRVECPEHGVRQVRVPWAEPQSRFTLLMERFAIDVLLSAATVKSASRILRISWDEAWGIKERAVQRGRARKERRIPAHVGVDEKAIRKGHCYLTIVCDVEKGSVEHVARHRRIESLESYFKCFSEAELREVRSVVMDMWGPYVQATLRSVPDAEEKIVFDRFHIMTHVGKAVDQVRREEHGELLRQGNPTLKKTRFIWLYSEENLPDRHRSKLEFLRTLNLQVGRAWAIKESLRALWDYRRPGWARRYFQRWYAWAIRSRLEPMKRVARMLKQRIDNVVTFCKHRVTQGVAEGINSKVMAIKRHACGFRNAKHFETAIFFHCGGLDLYPAHPQ